MDSDADINTILSPIDNFSTFDLASHHPYAPLSLGIVFNQLPDDDVWMEICDINPNMFDKRKCRDNKPSLCKICCRTFSHSGNLQKHFRTHSGEKPFHCTICQKGFSQNSDLKKHLRIHTGEKPFVCKICDHSFTQSCSLQKHIRTHTGDKPYACSMCNKCFTTNSNLLRHVRKHTTEYLNLDVNV